MLENRLRCLVLGLIVASGSTLFGLTIGSSSAVAYSFDRLGVRDWTQDNYNTSYLYQQGSGLNDVCQVLPSLAYRAGGGVPRAVGTPTNNIQYWYTTPDSWGSTVNPTVVSYSWTNVKGFRDHFLYYPPSGTSFTRISRHRASVAPDKREGWLGGCVVFYHHARANGDPPDPPEDYPSLAYYHAALIYAQNTTSAYKTYTQTYVTGTCKVDRSLSSPYYTYRNLINLRDRYPKSEREDIFVQVNTLVDN